MDNGIYTAYSGLKAQAEALDLISNNLANANTTGFKEEMAYFAAIDPSASNSNDLGTIINRSVELRGAMNVSEGSLTKTDGDLDIAIEGNGFLAVQTPQGVRYTRNGNLKLNAKGMLCTNDDALVLGSKGKPISLGSGKISIGADGSVALKGAAVDKLKIVSFKDIRNLVREGNSLFMVPDGKDQEKPSSAAIKSGYLESSNVNPVSSMIRMMSVLRQFESIQKTVNLVLNDMDVKSIDKLGR